MLDFDPRSRLEARAADSGLLNVALAAARVPGRKQRVREPRPRLPHLPGRGTFRQIKTGAGFKLKNKNGPFSSVSTATIARVGSFFSIFRDLQD